MDKDYRQEFKNRLRADYNMPDNAITDAITEATAICVDRGYAEMAPLREKYDYLICPWCGHLHHCERCINAMVAAAAETDNQ